MLSVASPAPARLDCACVDLRAQNTSSVGGSKQRKAQDSASLPSRLDNKPRLRVSDIGSRPTLAVCPTQHLPYGEGDSFVRLYTARNTAWERNCGTALELQDGSKFKRERYN